MSVGLREEVKDQLTSCMSMDLIQKDPGFQLKTIWREEPAFPGLWICGLIPGEMRWKSETYYAALCVLWFLCSRICHVLLPLLLWHIPLVTDRLWWIEFAEEEASLFFLNTRSLLGRCQEHFVISFSFLFQEGRSGLCVLVCTHVIVGEIVHWINPSQPRSGMPSKEGGGPLNNLLSGGDTSTR